jgi:hypothetical protein
MIPTSDPFHRPQLFGLYLFARRRIAALERLGALRLDAEVSRAKLYVHLQRIVNAGELTRACDLRGLLRAKEAEVVTLDRVAEAARDRLIALRSRLLVSGGPTPIDGTTICGCHGICAHR